MWPNRPRPPISQPSRYYPGLIACRRSNSDLGLIGGRCVGSSLFLLTDNFVEGGLVLGGAAGAGFGVDDTRGFWLAYTLAGVGFDGLGG